MNSSVTVPATIQPSVLNQIVQAIEATESNPNVGQIVADIKLALDLFMEFRNSTQGLHPSVWKILKLLI